jgi:hypothetical protein
MDISRGKAITIQIYELMNLTAFSRALQRSYFIFGLRPTQTGRDSATQREFSVFKNK